MHFLSKASRNKFRITYTHPANMNTVMENVIVRNLPIRTENVEQRFQVARSVYPASKYNIIGFVNRTHQIVLEPRFYNVRDSKGRWTATFESLNS